jgi:hypothetical protein
VDFHPALADDPVGRQILSLEVHVDRHVMFGTTSTDWRDEIYGCNTATLLDERDCIGRDEEFHGVLSKG